jgi:hypothetical protein
VTGDATRTSTTLEPLDGDADREGAGKVWARKPGDLTPTVKRNALVERGGSVKRCFLGLVAAVLAVAVWPAFAAAAPTVTVRVEGQNATLLPPTTVTLGAADITMADGSTCHGNTAAAALDKATGGNWDRLPFTSTILGESHMFTTGVNDYWAEWVSNHVGNGICNDALNEGDELLMLVDFSDANFNPTVFPLVLGGAPAKVAPGASFTVSVMQYRGSAPGSGTAEPAAGVTVGNATTGADGKATLSLTGTGQQTLRAVRGTARSAPISVCVTTGSDGACGTTVAPAACKTTGDDGNCGTKDKRAPRGKIESIREGQHFGKGKGPRALKGIVTPDPSGIADVRLRLTRNDHGQCQTFDGRSERLVRLKRCGAKRGKWFSAGDREQWSYLLPSRLGQGRWVLDLQARDKAGNVDTLLQRTRTRVVFTVS